MAAARQNRDLYGLPFQIPPRPIQYFLRTHREGVAARNTNIEALFVFRVPTQGPFAGQLDTIVDLVWQLLPPAWKPASSLKMYYGFHPDNPKLRADDENRGPSYTAPQMVLNTTRTQGRMTLSMAPHVSNWLQGIS